MEDKTEICKHHRQKHLGYVAWHDWADSLTKKGINQRQCIYCKHWFFPEEINDDGDDTDFDRQFDQPVVYGYWNH